MKFDELAEQLRLRRVELLARMEMAGLPHGYGDTVDTVAMDRLLVQLTASYAGSANPRKSGSVALLESVLRSERDRAAGGIAAVGIADLERRVQSLLDQNAKLRAQLGQLVVRRSGRRLSLAPTADPVSGEGAVAAPREIPPAPKRPSESTTIRRPPPD